MEVKKDILWRVYLCYLGMIAFGGAILFKAFFIQNIEGKYWRNMADSLHTQFVTLEAERGTIFSEEGRMLSASIPYFDIRLDLNAVREYEADNKKASTLFKDNLDSLCTALSHLFNDQPAADYKRMLQMAYNNRERYFLLKKAISFEQYQELRNFPLFRLGPNKGGLIAEVINKRINPFKLLANRTIGLSRANAQNVGLEKTYDEYLKGVSGKKLMRRIAGGTYIPVEGYEIDPENGKDLITTIDVNMQDIVEGALKKMMVENQAEHGTCIVMEVKTGKIKAIANLGRQPNGSYWEDYNYAIMTTEPGSTFKLATLISVLEDRLVTANSMVNLNKGTWQYGRRTVYDSEHHGKTWVTLKEAFELSSNVAFSQMAYLYNNNPSHFINHLRKLRLDQPTGVDLVGEGRPIVKTPASRTWSATSLPWMGFGYEVLISPLQTLALYNAVANNGRMMKPYLVNAIMELGKEVKKFKPTVLVNKICSDTTLQQLKPILEGVVLEGTAKNIYCPYYRIAGKTGTALVANGNRGYADKIYQSSFVGYFPADHPMYSCIVVIKNQPHAAKFYGAAVAAPVFKEIADKLYALTIEQHPSIQQKPQVDTLVQVKNGYALDLQTIFRQLGISCYGNAPGTVWAAGAINGEGVQLQSIPALQGMVPNVSGMGLKDALYLLENMGLKVIAKGSGKVINQSIPQGTKIEKGQTILIQLG